MNEASTIFSLIHQTLSGGENELLLPNKNIGNLVEQKESGDPIRRML